MKQHNPGKSDNTVTPCQLSLGAKKGLALLLPTSGQKCQKVDEMYNLVANNHLSLIKTKAVRKKRVW